jgi:hypothetical protein
MIYLKNVKLQRIIFFSSSKYFGLKENQPEKYLIGDGENQIMKIKQLWTEMINIFPEAKDTETMK